MSPTPRSNIGAYLRFALLAVCLTATSGCWSSSGHEGKNWWFTLSKHSDKAYFLVGKDFSYEVSASDPVILRKGKLDDATVLALQSMLDDDSITRYLEIQGKGSYDDRCVQMGVVIEFANHGVSCWVPSEVTDESTKRMLDYLLQLYEQIRSS